MANNSRKIKEIIDPQYAIEGAGGLLRRSFGPSRENLFDPFLLFDHFAFDKPTEGPPTGFPNHPHRGIETVTYMIEGNVRHRDSLGNSDVIGPGDIQWMTSGRGIMHEEMPKRGPSGIIDGFQLWVNLPAAQKMTDPRYQGVLSENIPTVEDDGVKVKIIAGEYSGVQGPVTEIAAKPLYMDISVSPEKEFSVPIPQGHNAVAYVFEGEGKFGIVDGDGGQNVPAINMVIYEDGDSIFVQTGKDHSVRFMLIAGAQIKEDIVPYGPFVMNTEAEIRQTFLDLQSGTFGQL